MSKAAFNHKLILIHCTPRAELSRGKRKVLHAERYLGRQAYNAHMLGVRDLEFFYNVGYLAPNDAHGLGSGCNPPTDQDGKKVSTYSP